MDAKTGRAPVIIGTGSAWPERAVSNLDLQNIVDTSDEWITRRTGIRQRFIARADQNEETSDLAASASLAALEMAGKTPADLDMIILGTVTGDKPFPACACLVQDKIKAKKAAAFDISAGCSGFIYSLSMAQNLIKAGQCNTVLVIGVDRISVMLDWKDRANCVLFGDGAGAVVVAAGEGPEKILSTHIRSDGACWDMLYGEYGAPYVHPSLEPLQPKPFHVVMEGNRVFKKAVSSMASLSHEALKANNLTGEDIALLIPHQANMRIITALAERVNVDMDRVYTNIDRFGNTSSGSIPIALDEAHRKGVIQKGDHVLLVTFGAGPTWGASVISWGI
ncbi:3-oxoacyl-[acyl-carrier-protein] synthase-3 [Desulfatibacillum alkenivorans DSM 16219]|jgi:3-oxoacyl-[acyl-carrier-protein] synthase-3|uniref:Beta-ketoacyl-[acyl-carrier-protein] synthase III n=1 Tax=Desulfatibacillum alkenivorans DSM 16219 TaxID=1121393 RepID=A0A1M6PEV0_9BACT|nr:beta-ketoacyl-ACP synthase III [Desulfatibacillum alkenivorans]SHK06430.1 3-oxoacyl-[acyl-carrier-protein] synthase-3 [Desulfatibacillum alkenivorans DSM 16219]